MKKTSLISMVLIGLFGFGMMFGGCDNGSTGGNGGETTDTTTKVVAAKYQGTWILMNGTGNSSSASSLTISENKCAAFFSDGRTLEFSVYTVGSELHSDESSGYTRVGVFTNNTTLQTYFGGTDGPEGTGDYIDTGKYTRQQ